MQRRRFLAALSGTAATLSGCVSAPRNFEGATVMDRLPVGPTVALEPVAVGPTSDGDPGPRAPVDLAVAPDRDRRYVVDRYGLVWTHGPDGFADRSALSLADRVLTDGEQGLLGLALHPEFERNRRLFVRYSAPPTRGMPSTASHAAVLSQFRATDDGRRIDPESERRLLEVAEPGIHHNGGAVTFGPDGYLYLSLGDGQWSRYPTSPDHIEQAEDWYAPNRGGNGQETERNLLGSILRIDVDAGGPGEYGVPPDNPLVGEPGLDEHYAWGFRNPWRMGFSAGDLYVADVGEYDVEEIDRVVEGGNYGWNVREGTTCFNAERPSRPLPDCPSETPGGEPLRDPVVQYTHEVRTRSGVRNVYSAVVGGYRYRAGAVPALDGRYVFGDFTGQLFAATPAEEGLWPMERVRVAGGFGGQLLSFARDADGELLVLWVGETGRIDRVVAASG